MARLSREDWLAEGRKVLEAFAQHRLKIAYLCERLKVTRGSFYHHFTSIEDYKMQLLQHWEQAQTLAIIEGVKQASTPAEHMEQLTQLVARSNHRVEAAIRSWGFYDEGVKGFLEKVDAKRLEHLEGIFTAMGLPSDVVPLVAKLDYATLIGIQQLHPDISLAELGRLWEVQGHYLRYKQ